MLTVLVHAREGALDLEAFARQLPSHGPVIWLDSARPHPVTGRWSLLGFDPWLTLRSDGERTTWTTSAATLVWRTNPWEALGHVLKRYQAPKTLGAARRAVGLLGCLSYDANRWLERVPSPPPAQPAWPESLWLAMRSLVLVDHLTERTWLVSVADPHQPRAWARRAARENLARLHAFADNASSLAGSPETLEPVTVQATTPQPDFERAVERILAHIRAGDLYQANLSQRFTGPAVREPFALYRRLRRLNPSPFAAYLRVGSLAVMSCSPERLVRVQEGWVDTRPIAGTRPRGRTAQEDAMQSLDLLLSDKERAEHLMLVDLARNDLGRVCRGGSVQVDELMAVESYSHVLHIVSNVAGRLQRGVNAIDVLRAVFPGGTITGCPKVRCMEMLAGLEPVRRGLYTGTLGYLSFSGDLDLNIAIRTIVQQGTQLSFHVGAGIVADSVPAREYEETLAKGQALMAALGAAQPEAAHA